MVVEAGGGAEEVAVVWAMAAAVEEEIEAMLSSCVEKDACRD
jgi:hypothetical protein